LRPPLARMRQSFEPFAVLAAQPNYVFIDRNLSAVTNLRHRQHRGGRDSEKHHNFKDEGD
jgi:hypothetical protein